MPPARTRTEYPEQHERDAARRYLEHDYAARRLSGAPAREANRHAQAIDEEHPRARDIAMTGTERELGRIPAHLRRHQQTIRREAGLTDQEIARIRREYRSRPAERIEDEPRQPAPAPTPAAGRVAAAGNQAIGLVGTGLSAAADTSWGDLLTGLFLGGVGLSIAYLFLTHNKAASELFVGATNVTRAIVSPTIDPLNPKGALA